VFADLAAHSKRFHFWIDSPWTIFRYLGAFLGQFSVLIGCSKWFSILSSLSIGSTTGERQTRILQTGQPFFLS
jgi:hypothetical protein